MRATSRIGKALLSVVLLGLLALPAIGQVNPVTGSVELPRESSALRLATPELPGHRLAFQNSDYAVGGVAPAAVSVGDFNHDGKPDLAVANLCASGNYCGGSVPGSVSILLGNGDGSFQPQVSYQTGEFSRYLAVADFNGDGNQDLAVANGQDATVGILLGNGDGTFQPQVVYNVGPWVVAIAVGDFNRDGKLDLVATNFYLYGPSLSVLLGNGDGTFQAQTQIPLREQPTGIAAGDFNRDGKLDLAVGIGVGFVDIFLGNGDGTFQGPVQYQAQSGTESVVAADFNQDGKLDVAVTNLCGEGGPGCQTPGSVSVFLGKGDGTFQAQQVYATEFEPWGLATADFNGDGKLDLAAADFTTFTVSLFVGNGDGTFQAQRVLDTEVQTYPLGLATGAFNQQGTNSADIVVADSAAYYGTSVTVMLNMAATQMKLKSTPNPSKHGQSVTFTVAVKAAVKGSGSPTGDVTFKHGSTKLGTAALVKGVAAFSYSKLPVGKNKITATYEGDRKFNPHTSTPLVQVVNP